MTIDHAKVREYAVELKSLLARYAPLEPEAAIVQRELMPLIDAVLHGTASLPYRRVPCGWYFVEGGLAELDDLAEAFSKFAFWSEGRDFTEAQQFASRLRSDPEFAAHLLSPQLGWRERLWSAWIRLTRPPRRR